MRILISGSTGMIGSFLVPYLAQRGHSVVRLVRRPPVDGEVRWDPAAGQIDAAGLEGFDGVVNLACLPWPARWTASSRQAMLNNRLATNGLLAESLSSCQIKPAVLVCSSGMGIYPSMGEQEITEDSPLGSDFLARLQQDGEAVAMKATQAGIRVVNLRTPGVLGGAAIQRTIGKIGDGQQWSPWISRDELSSIIEYVIATNTITGPLNPCSPNPIRNSEYVATSSQVKGAKPAMSIPAFMIKLMMGELGQSLVLASRKMLPHKLLQHGYQFRFPTFESALRRELALLGA
jgi:uncharacterized protein (TIGR01777 family)